MQETLLWNIPLKDWLTVIAILLAPLAALWIQSKLDELKSAARQRLDIFKTLMATRASVLSSEHVKALNMIDIEFYRAKKYREIRKAWRSYLHVRTTSVAPTTEAQYLKFVTDCQDTLTDLLVKMADALGYEFDETHIKQSIYKPQGHVNEESYQMFMREKMWQLFSGNFSLPMDIKSLPTSPEEAEEQKKFRNLAIRFFEKKLSENIAKSFEAA